jgi:hypothetical protein
VKDAQVLKMADSVLRMIFAEVRDTLHGDNIDLDYMSISLGDDGVWSVDYATQGRGYFTCHSRSIAGLGRSMKKHIEHLVEIGNLPK